MSRYSNINVALRPGEHAALAEYAAMHRRSISDVVRSAVITCFGQALAEVDESLKAAGTGKAGEGRSLGAIKAHDISIFHHG
jgi:hypothetical protein